MYVSDSVHAFVLDLEPGMHIFQEYIDYFNSNNGESPPLSFGQWEQEHKDRFHDRASNAWDWVSGGCWNSDRDSPDRDSGGSCHHNSRD